MAQVFDLTRVAKLVDLLDSEAKSLPLSYLHHGVSAIVVIDKAGIPFLQALQSLLNQKFLRELLVVDRGAPKELLETLKNIAEELPHLKLIEDQAHLTVLQAYQLAAKRAVAKNLLFVEQHTVLPNLGIIQLLLASLEMKEKNWIISAVSSFKPSLPEHELLDPKEAVLSMLKLRKSNMTFPKEGTALTAHVPAMGFGCFLIPRNAFWQNEGFDEACHHSAAMLDLCLKMHLKGGGVYKVPTLKVRTYGEPQEESEFASLKGLIHFYRKHYAGSPTKHWLGPLFILLSMKALYKRVKKLFSFKSKTKKEQSLTELLNKKTLA